jgi:hypothetical protein
MTTHVPEIERKGERQGMMAERSLKIIVEGASDAQIIRAILGEALSKKVRIFAGQGRASLARVGRNVLFHEGGPVLLVMDSDTLDPRLTAELQSMTRVAMSGAITSGVQLPVPTAAEPPPFRVFTFVPEIKAVFFEAPQVLERTLGKTPSCEKVKDGRLVPKQTLTDLLGEVNGAPNYHVLLGRIDPAIGSGTQASALKQIVESMLAV